MPIIPPRKDAKARPGNPDLKARDEAIQFIEDGLAKGLTLQHDLTNRNMGWNGADHFRV